MDWNDERIEVLTKLWLDGLSASEIAKQLGGVTRNGVIGKVHRLGLVSRMNPSAPGYVGNTSRTTSRPLQAGVPHKKGGWPRKSTTAVTTTPPPTTTAASVAVEPPPQKKAPVPIPIVYEDPGTATIFTLGAHMCKWPIGDPGTDGFTFCGRRCGNEGPYCREHARVAYQVPRQRKRTTATELAHSLRRYI